MSLALWHWHIEASSKCTLRCPRCARSEVPDTLVNTELDLAFFKKNFTPEFINQHVEKITFCGDDGDPIYCHDFIDIIRYVKSCKNVAIVIVTNGSYKKEDWWAELANELTVTDHVHFSIDGYDQQSNEQYRVNSDYESIMLGVRTLRSRSSCYMTWDCIGFRFNETKIELMRRMARDLGFDQFQLTRSTKFGSIYDHYKNDELEPTRPDLISSTHRFERRIFNLSGRKLEEQYANINEKLYNSVEVVDNIKPICKIGNKGLFINSQGDFFPCCWVANRYSHNTKWAKLGKQYNLHTNNLLDVVNSTFWQKEFLTDSYECSTKCAAHIVDKNYATEW